MTKIDIFSGFLGAGKTTLIKKLIKESFAGQKVVLIENEFGEIGIDGGFLKESGIQINELNAGCICCSLVGDFRAALQQVVEQYHPDRIVIEPSGVGKLSDVTRAVEGVAEHLDVQLSSFVTVADVNKVKMYMKNFGEFYDDQISHASCIILSRTQNATEEKIAAAVALLREKNPTATIVTTAWDALTGEQILKAMSTKDDFKAELIAMAAKANEEHAHEDEEEEHEHEHHHDHEDGHDHCCCGHHHDDDEDDDEQRKRERIGERRQLHALEQILADADDERADDRAGDRPDAAKDGGDERLQARHTAGANGNGGIVGEIQHGTDGRFKAKIHIADNETLHVFFVKQVGSLHALLHGADAAVLRQLLRGSHDLQTGNLCKRFQTARAHFPSELARISASIPRFPRGGNKSNLYFLHNGSPSSKYEAFHFLF